MSSSDYYKADDNNTPVVVQGQEVRYNGAFSQTLSPAQTDNMSTPIVSSEHPTVTGPAQYQPSEPPPRGCRDAAFAIIFYIHIAIVGWAAVTYTPIMARDVGEGMVNDGWGQDRRRLNEDGADNGKDQIDINFDAVHLTMITVISALLAFVCSTLALGLMISCAQLLIKMALLFNVLLSLALMILSFATAAIPMGVVFLLMCLMASYYAYHVWARIPFAAANLVTAVTAIRANLGLAVYAYWSVVVLFIWSIVWALSSSATIFVAADCNADGECQNSISAVLLFLFFLSYYWTAQVIANVVHVTAAGTVGTWWFRPEEAKGCCSSAVRESYGRSLTTSFGSICFGSLIVAIIQTIKEMIYQMRDGEDSVLACVAVCILNCIESLVEYFNKWAFVYVGLYGYSFMEAGSNVMGLFRSRGWTSIIADVMVDTVLFMLSAGVALLIATLSVIIGASMQVDDEATLVAAFLLGLLIGYGICATLFSLVSSGVNTVIVCFAEAPNEFQKNHPQLSERMRDSWRQAWPSDFNF